MPYNEIALGPKSVDTPLPPPKKHGSSSIHTVLFNKRYWSVDKAKKWLLEQGLIAPKVRETAHFYRFRQIDPKYFKSFSTIEATPTIRLVIGYY